MQFFSLRASEGKTAHKNNKRVLLNCSTPVGILGSKDPGANVFPRLSACLRRLLAHVPSPFLTTLHLPHSPLAGVALTCRVITTHICAFHRAASERCFRGKRPPAVTFLHFIFEAQFGLKSLDSQL